MHTNPRTPVIIDCDPGVDDAIALMVALNSAAFEVRGITAVAGNVPLALTELNARKICTLVGRTDVPVYAGCPRPLLGAVVTAEQIHGTTGLDGATLPDPGFPVSAGHAVAFLIEALASAPQPVTLACTAPLTNLAAAIVQQPGILANVREVVIMGGGVNCGNITPVAEFNFYADPYAARIVFEADVPITLVPLDITHQVLTTPVRLDAIRAAGNPVSTAAADLLAHYGQFKRPGLAGAPLHDPCVIACLLEPGLFSGYPAQVTIETSSPLTMGQSVVNRRQLPDDRAPVTVLDTVDVNGVYDLIIRNLTSV